MKSDILLVLLSDMHSGSNSALFLNRFWKGKNGNHTPTSKQELIRKQFDMFAGQVEKARKGKRVVIVNDGDAIEGVHHNNVDVCTRDVLEQMNIHIELMLDFKKRIKWQRGDELHYVRGTETHSLDTEEDIARELDAIPNRTGSYVSDHLSLDLNGAEAWFIHEGAVAGKGANEGNSLRNWLRDVYWDLVKEHQKPPDIIYSGHVHQPTYNTYVANDRGQFITIHGVILPSWQAKTRYAYKVAPVAKNKVGGVTQVFTASGDIQRPLFSVMETESISRVG